MLRPGGLLAFCMPSPVIDLVFEVQAEIVDLVELRPPEDADSTYDFVPLEWARRWPAENIWKARKPVR